MDRRDRRSFNRKPEACAFRLGECTGCWKRLRTNLRSVPGFGLNERLQQLEATRLTTQGGGPALALSALRVFSFYSSVLTPHTAFRNAVWPTLHE